MAGRPRSLGVIAAEGDRLKTLEALRDRIARTIDSPKTLARDLAALSRQLVQITAEIDDLRKPAAASGSSGGAPAGAEPSPPVNGLDEFQKKLAEKRAAAG